MNGAYFGFLKSKGYVPDTTAEAKELHKEKCLLRLARIQNNAEPSHKNGTPKRRG